MWKEKLQAFCVALEMENIPELLDRATVGDFSRIGAVMSSRIKDIAAAQNTSTNSAIVPCDGCSNLRGRHCMLSTNHCTRRAEDFFSTTGGGA